MCELLQWCMSYCSDATNNISLLTQNFILSIKKGREVSNSEISITLNVNI